MSNAERLQVEARMRDAGIKLTPQRFAILDYLLKSRAHPTADQIGGDLNRRFPRASRATIYNSLHALCAVGLVREIYIDGAVARYEAMLAPHHHFYCRLCGRLEDVPHETVGSQLASLTAKELGAAHTVESYEVVLRGVCAKCNG